MNDPTPIPLAPPAPTTNLQELLNRKSDAELNEHLTKIFEPVFTALKVYTPGDNRYWLLHQHNITHPTKSTRDILCEMRDAYFKALQPIWRQKATEDFLKKVESFQAQLDELQSQIPQQ